MGTNESQLVTWLRRHCRRAGSMLEGPHNNLEHVLTFDSLNKSYDAEHEYDTYFANIISKVYTRSLTNSGLLSLHQICNLFDAWNHKHNICFITTNYDILIEGAYASLGMPLYLPGVWSEQAIHEGSSTFPLYSRTTGNTRHSICKLHGSVNWEASTIQDSDNDSVITNIVGSMTSFQIHTGSSQRPIATTKYPELLLAETDMPKFNAHIIPPTFSKGYSAEMIDAQWLHAHKALSEAREIHFIGYSFPSTDTHMRYFIASALARNEHIRKINIINPEAESIYTRLIDRKTGFGHEFEQKLTYENTGWIEKLPQQSRPHRIRRIQIS